MRLGFIAFLLALAGTAAYGQTNIQAAGPDEFFNIGSATFIREDPEKALSVVNEGLSLYPDNQKLLRLKSLLEQEEQQQSQQNEQNQEEEQDQKDQQDQQPSNSESQNQQDEKQNEQQPENEKPEDSKEKNGEEKDEQNKKSAEEMTKSEAEMVLDSLRQLEQAQREKLMQEMIRRKMQDLPPVEKDW